MRRSVVYGIGFGKLHDDCVEIFAVYRKSCFHGQTVVIAFPVALRGVYFRFEHDYVIACAPHVVYVQFGARDFAANVCGIILRVGNACERI